MSNNDRQREFRERQKAIGLVPVTLWVPRNEMGSFQLLSKAMCDNRDLEMVAAPVRDVATGRMVKVL